MKLPQGFKCPKHLKSMFACMDMPRVQRRQMMAAEAIRVEQHRQMLKRKWVDVLSEDVGRGRPRRSTTTAEIVE